jgi:hypothetical protein
MDGELKYPELLTIDPGACTGAAYFRQGRLVWVMCKRFEQIWNDELRQFDLEYAGQHLLIEIPRVYPSGRQPVDPNDLITLAVRAGRLIEMSRGQLGTFETCFPSDWKAQVPDDILYKRLESVLSSEERVVVDAYKCAKHTKHNMLDAIGIGLWKLGRVGAGMKRSMHVPSTEA